MDATLAQSQHTAQKPMSAPPDLIAEANHRIANSLTLLVSMVRMQAVSVKKGAAVLTNVVLDDCRISVRHGASP